MQLELEQIANYCQSFVLLGNIRSYIIQLKFAGLHCWSLQFWYLN
jgi:hypothetical protein